MKIKVESSKVIGAGAHPQIAQDEQGKVHFFYEAGGKIHYAQSDIELGMWDTLNFSDPYTIAPDDSVDHFNVEYMPDGKMWFVWKNGDTHRFAVHEDDGPTHELNSPYRLYYAVDTEKLYMNVSETWQYIGSPNIANLEGYQAIIDLIATSHTPGYDDTALRESLTSLTSSVATIAQDVEVLKTRPPGGGDSYDHTALEDRIAALEQGGVQDSTGLDMKAVHRILALSAETTSEDTTNFYNALKATGHTVTLATTAALDTVDPSLYDIIAIRYWSDTESRALKLRQLHDKGMGVIICFQGDALVSNKTDLLTAFGIGEFYADSAPANNYYIAPAEHPVTKGYGIGTSVTMANSPDWHCQISGATPGVPLLFRDALGELKKTVAISGGTTSLKGTPIPYNMAFTGLLYGRGGIPPFGVDHIDKLVRWIVQGNKKLTPPEPVPDPINPVTPSPSVIAAFKAKHIGYKFYQIYGTNTTGTVDSLIYALSNTAAELVISSTEAPSKVYFNIVGGEATRYLLDDLNVEFGPFTALSSNTGFSKEMQLGTIGVRLLP